MRSLVLVLLLVVGYLTFVASPNPEITVILPQVEEDAFACLGGEVVEFEQHGALSQITCRAQD